MSRIPFSVRRGSEVSEEDYWVKQLVTMSYGIVAINFSTHFLLWLYTPNTSPSIHFTASLLERIQPTFWMLLANVLVAVLVKSTRLSLLVKEYLAIMLLIFLLCVFVSTV